MFINIMSIESFNRTSNIIETPIRVNVDVLKQRLMEQKKKEKVFHRVSLGSLNIQFLSNTILK